MEQLTVIQGLKIALYGFVTVFVMLAVLMLIINILSKVVAMIIKPEVKDEVTSQDVEEDNDVVVVPDLPKQYVGELKLIDVDEKTAACIMAIISEETQIPLENLIFKRIELIKEEK